MVVGKRMERLDQKMAFPFLDMQVTHSPIRDSSARIEHVQKFLFAIASLQLRLNHPKHFWGDRLPFAFDGIADRRLTVDGLMVLAPNGRGNDSSLLGQDLIARTNHFGKNRMATNEGNDVTVTCDVDPRTVLAARDTTCAKDLEKLWVYRSSKEIQRVFCDGWPNR
jgi:hypothetical protein